MRQLIGIVAAASVAMLSGAEAQPAAPAQRHPLAAPLCSGLARSIANAGPGPVFVASYHASEADGDLPPLPIRSSAFTYDNALAMIASIACGQTEDATRIGKAISAAIDRDRRFKDGRIRNAYRAGPVKDGPVLLPGWWDAGNARWAEDAYQDGTATGNVAWAALGLLNLHQATGEAWTLESAERLADWIQTMSGGPGPAGFMGGLHGFDDTQVPLKWKSTEHHADIAAVSAWLYRLTGKPAYAEMNKTARGFLLTMFDGEAGLFRMGTLPDGTPAQTDRIALDAQVWPLIAVADPPQQWNRTLDLIDKRLAVPGGYDFNEDRDGVWTEGTAQVALVRRAMGDPKAADALIEGLSGELTQHGWMRATAGQKLTTGLEIGPDSTSNDFFYFPRPHLGATAWAALAAEGWNPFTGKRVE